MPTKNELQALVIMTAWRLRETKTCNGTIVLHSDGEYECLDGECRPVGNAYHDMGVECAGYVDRGQLKKICSACEFRANSPATC